MREERARDAVESGGKALCVGGVEAEGVDGFIAVKKTRDANCSTWNTLIHTMTTTAIIRQSSRLACTALCRRRLVAHFASPNSLQFDKVPQRRTFVSTRPHRAAPAPTPTATPAVLRRSPTTEDIENAELDMEPLAQTDARLALTERAAEVHHYSTPTY
jgi:hypothetical protein